MKTIPQVIKESAEEAKVNFPQELLGQLEHRGFYDCGKYLDEELFEVVKKPLIQSQITLLDHIREWAESKRSQDMPDVQGGYYKQQGYNRGMEQLITLLDESIKEVKETH